MRILVVDDVGYVRHYFDRLLTQNGHVVWTAASGYQAIDILNQDKAIQVVITDLLMPGMDGLQFYRESQKIGWCDSTGAPLSRPVFYLITAMRPSTVTPHRETNMLKQALEMGFAEVLLKPIDNEHLLRQLSLLQQKLICSEPVGGSAAPVSHSDLLHAIDQNIERMLGCENGSALAELNDLLQGSLARIPKIIRTLDASPVADSRAQATNHERSLPSANSPSEPLLSTGHVLSTGNGLVATNGLSTEKQL